MVKFKITSSILTLIFLFSCNNVDKSKVRLNPSNLKSGKQELKKVLDHYHLPEDSLKRFAAQYLFKYMTDHGTIRSSWINSEGKQAQIDLDKYSNISQLRQDMDSRGFYQIIEKKVDDKTNIQSDYIINNIDASFDSFNENPFNLQISFNEFCELLLPYRIGSEVLEDWRYPIRELLLPKLDSLITSSDTIDHAEIIHELLSTFKYGYNSKAMALSPHQCLSEMRSFKVGTCEDISQLGVMTCRALGIPSALDLIPIWGSFNGAHARTMYKSVDGSMKILGDRDNMYKRPAKVFRKVYSSHNKLHRLIADAKDIPPLFRDQHIIDVTQEHCPTKDVKIKLDKVKDLPSCLFIYVFNFGRWQPIFWGEVTDGKLVEFNSMGTQVIYRVGKYKKGITEFVSQPFLLNEDGTINFFDKEYKETESIEVNKDWGTIYLGDLHLKEKDKYTLYCWQEGWKKLEESVATIKPHKYMKEGIEQVGKKLSVRFENVPRNGLLRVSNQHNFNTSRLILVKNNKIRWY